MYFYNLLSMNIYASKKETIKGVHLIYEHEIFYNAQESTDLKFMCSEVVATPIFVCSYLNFHIIIF